MTKLFSHEVTLPLKNHLQAERDIRTLMVYDDIAKWDKLIRRPKVDLAAAMLIDPNRPLRYLVDAFMAAYPRGNGTVDDYRLRTLYAACKAIKINSSRIYRFGKNLVAFKDMTDNQIAYLAKMPLDGSSTKEVLGNRASLKRLISLELVNGYFDDDYKEVEYWLTDDGLNLAKFASNYLGDRALKAHVVLGTVPETIDYEAMKRAIMALNVHDAKTFVEEAAKIVRLLGEVK